jgi:hypothetical protein
MERQEFIDFLRGTLIPDLLEYGHEFTAKDFEMACQFMENPATQFVQAIAAANLKKTLTEYNLKKQMGEGSFPIL